MEDIYIGENGVVYFVMDKKKNEMKTEEKVEMKNKNMFLAIICVCLLKCHSVKLMLRYVTYIYIIKTFVRFGGCKLWKIKRK